MAAELDEPLLLELFPRLIFVCTGLNEELAEKLLKAGLALRVGEGFLFSLVIFGRRLLAVFPLSENMTGDDEADEFEELDADSLLPVLFVIASISAECSVSLRTDGIGEELCESRLGLACCLAASWYGDMDRARGGGMTRTGDLRIPSLVGFANLLGLSGLGSGALLTVGAVGGGTAAAAFWRFLLRSCATVSWCWVERWFLGRLVEEPVVIGDVDVTAELCGGTGEVGCCCCWTSGAGEMGLGGWN